MLGQLVLLLGVPPGEGQLPHVTGEEPLLSGFVQVGFDWEEISDGVSEDYLGWAAQPCAPVMCTKENKGWWTCFMVTKQNLAL